MKNPSEVWIRESGCIAWKKEDALEQLQENLEAGITEDDLGPFRLYRLVPEVSLVEDLPPSGQ